MDIPALSMALSQQKLADSINVSVMKMSLDTAEQVGEQIQDLMETMVPLSESSIDISV